MKSEPTLLKPAKMERRHDLDALRAIAMLLGIVLHGLMPFIGLPEFIFPIQDVSQMPALGMILSGIHGFRMPLFFLISGFFTTMLWRRRGLNALIHHRFKRIFLPLLLGLVTIIPLTNMVYSLPYWSQEKASVPSATNNRLTLVQNGPSRNLFAFIESRNVSDIKSLLDNGVSPDTRHSKGYTALNATVYANTTEITKLLLDYGANPNLPSLEGDGNTPFMESAFWGQSEIFRLLLNEGADLSLTNNKGASAALLATVDINLAYNIAQFIGLRLTVDQIASGREEVLLAINQGLKDNPDAITPRLQTNKLEIKQLTGDSFAPQAKAEEDILTMLMYMPIFHHLWFLWYLCCLVAAFSLWALAADKLKLTFPRWLIMPPVCFLWLLPLTYFFQNQMGYEHGPFGPDTATGLIPVPAIIGFYAIFFFYGAWYYDCDDSKGELGKYWWFSLPIAQLLIHPIGLEFASGDFGFRHELASFEHYRLLSVLFQIAYVWLMTTGCLGMFRKFFNHESKRMLYISDSSYWLYIAHIPLLFLLQYLTSTLEVSALIKAPMTILICSALL
ncbi:MAG: acyltransferase family protein, partial [Pirellulales bacterium]|nr:acyltransferase family protein [Pirellulales bacterium]